LNLYRTIKFVRSKRSGFKAGLVVLLVLGAISGFWFLLPVKLFNTPSSYVIEDRQGLLLGATVAGDGQWRFPYHEKVPDKFAACIITFEDKRFLFHKGIDPLAITRAIRQNLVNKKVISGGSTLSMQVIRLSRKKPRNLWQKTLEAILALRLEMTYSKSQIVALYSSNAPFGGNVVGLEAASWRYYGRSPSRLSWGEAAALAVLPNAPSLVHPGKNRQKLLKKRNFLLDQLLKENLIDATACSLAKLEPLPGEPKALPQLSPHLLQRFVDETKRQNSESLRIRTTIELDLQKQVNRIVEMHHLELKENGINNAAALVLEVETGNVLAYTGNVYHPENTELESHVDVIRARRSPGSALKPILYANMLTDGMILPHSIFPDIPTQIGGFIPQNFDRQYDGAVAASKAIARSLNIPAVKMLQQYRYPRFFDALKKSGLSTLDRPADSYGLSLILGGCEVTMWDLAGLYASLARAFNHQHRNRGKILTEDFHEPGYVIRESAISNRSQKLSGAIGNSSSTINHFDNTSIWYMFQAMEEVMRPGEEGLWQQFSSSQRIAWKTGTSFGFRDGWAVGVTPKNVVAVWVGNTDGEGRPGLVGVQTAAPILFDIFRLLPDSEPFSKPEFNYSYLPVCRKSGYRASLDCDLIDTVMVPRNGIKTKQCPYHKIIHLDISQKFQVTDNCAATNEILHRSWYILPPAMEWYYKQRHHEYLSPPPFKPGCGDFYAGRQIELIYPQTDAKIYVPVEIDGKKGKAIFTAAHRQNGAKIFWHLDNTFLEATTHNHQVAINPEVGMHMLTLVDEKGESISRHFEILEKRK
jgi:penicillin-binding protein 1C